MEHFVFLGFKGYKTCGFPDMAVDQTLNIIGRQCFNTTGAEGDFFVGKFGFSVVSLST